MACLTSWWVQSTPETMPGKGIAFVYGYFKLLVVQQGAKVLESQPPIDLPLFRSQQPNVAAPRFCTLRNPPLHGNQCSTLPEGMLESGILGETRPQFSFVGVRVENRPEF